MKQAIQSIKSKRVYWLLLSLVIIGYWPVSFSRFCLKNDTITCHFPPQYFIGECLKNGFLPLWNPYQFLGYPIHANPEGNVWNPVTWIVALLFGINIYTLHLQYILYVFLGGMGMLKLLKGLGMEEKIAFIAGAAYSFCGVFVANAEHFPKVIGAAWVPFVIHYYMQMLAVKKISPALKCSLSLLMLVSGGYPAFSVILAYLLAVLFLFQLFSDLKEWRRSQALVALLKVNSIFLLSFLLFGAVIIISQLQVLPFMTRGGGVTADEANENPFSPRAMISFLLPFAVVKDVPYYGGALSMSNGYFGMIAFLFFILAFFRKRRKIENLFLFTGIFCLLVSFGEYLPLRKWLYLYFPFMDLFRHPGIFRLFVIICFLIIAGFSIQGFLNSREELRKRMQALIFTTGFLLIGFMIWSLLHSKEWFLLNHLNSLSHFSIKELLVQPNRYEHIFLHSVIQLVFLTLFYFVLKHSSPSRFFIALSFLIVLEILTSLQLNLPYSVVSSYRPEQVAELFKSFPKGFPLPDAQPVSQHVFSDEKLMPLQYNINNFTKEISHKGYSSFRLKGYSEMMESPLRNYFVNQPLLYFADGILPLSKTASFDTAAMKRAVFIDEEQYNRLAGKSFFASGEDEITLTEFAPAKLTAKSKTKNSRVLVLIQNNFPGWKVFVNGKKATHFTVNYSLMAVEVPAGENKIEFKYKPAAVIAGMYLSFVALMTVLSVIAFEKARREN